MSQPYNPNRAKTRPNMDATLASRVATQEYEASQYQCRSIGIGFKSKPLE